MKEQITVYEMLGIDEPVELLEKEQWCTPAEIIEDARAVMGVISLDPATSEWAQKTVKATRYYTAQDDGLSKEWSGKIWLNPPYTQGLIDKFVEKLLASDYDEAIVLTNNCTETRWFRKLVDKSSAVIFPTGRIQFDHPQRGGTTPLQGQTLFYLGENSDRFLSIFGKYGWGIHGQNNTRRLYADTPKNGE